MNTNAPISDEEMLLNIQCRLNTIGQLMEEAMLVFNKIKTHDLDDEACLTTTTGLGAIEKSSGAKH